MNIMKWVNILMWGTSRERSAVVNEVIESVKIYKKGKLTKKGEHYANILKSGEVDFIGFVPNITYVRAHSNDPEDLEVFWDHRFSAPTLLYHVKDSPIMLLVNPNVAYNDSRLLEIDENSELAEIRDLRGIIG
jgi:hypothetical protein